MTAAAIGFELCAILNSATCSVFGPGKFLRGKDGYESANQALEVLEEKSEITLVYFFSGFACLIISSILKSFLLQNFFNALIVSVGLVIMSWFLFNMGKRIKDSLYVPRGQATTGQIYEG